jgi:RNA polymerase sigma-70 factor (ECF subfamily)
MQQPDLNEIIYKCKCNNSDAFRKLVEMYQGPVFTFAFRMLCNEDESKDIVQETFIRVWKHLDNYNIEMKFTTWLFTITSNLCCDKLRLRRRNSNIETIDAAKIFASIENLETSAINSDLAKVIYTLTDKLTPKQKLVFTLRDLEGLEVEEVQMITGMTAGKIKSNLYLARQFIKNKLEKM